MGLFFSNFIVKGPPHWQVIQWLRQHERVAWVSRTVDHVTAILDDNLRCDGVIWRRFEPPSLCQRGESAWEPLVRDISVDLHCIALAAEVHDSDLLLYELYDAGRLVDEYYSDLDDDYFGWLSSYGNAPIPHRELLDRPMREHAVFLCRAFGQTDADAVTAVLAAPSEIYPCAEERHTAVIEALGLPKFIGAWALGPVEPGLRIPDFTATTE